MARELGRRMKRPADSDSGSDEDIPRDQGKGQANGNANGNAAAGPSRGTGLGDIPVPADDEPGWTIEDYQPKALTGDSRSGALLRKSVHQIGEVLRLLEDSLEKSIETAKNIEEVQPGNKLVDEIDAGVRKTLDQIQWLTYRKEVIESINTRANQGEAIQHPLEEYEQEVKVKVDQWNAMSERAKFKDHEKYIEFRGAIWAAANGDESECPPVTRWLDAGEGEEEDSDDDIEMGGRTQTFRCPLTLRTYDHAVTSRKCKHSYSKDAILAVFRKASRKGPAGAKCPVPGCKEWLTKDDLDDDPRLQKRADEFARKQATQNEADVSMAISVAGDDDDDEDRE